MSHIQYTICRSGTFYYNRRVPKHAVETHGQYIRLALSKDENEADAYSRRLSTVLEGSWAGTKNITPVDFVSVLESFKPRSVLLSEMAEEYLSLREIDLKPPRIVQAAFISLAGDRDQGRYSREDAELFVRHSTMKENKTATIRRRVNSLSARLNDAYSEMDLNKRTPFTRLIMRFGGGARFKRGVFTKDQMRQGYERALSSKNTVQLIMPLLGETGCRRAEIVGLTDTQIYHDVEYERIIAERCKDIFISKGYLKLVQDPGPQVCAVYQVKNWEHDEKVTFLRIKGGGSIVKVRAASTYRKGQKKKGKLIPLKKFLSSLPSGVVEDMKVINGMMAKHPFNTPNSDFWDSCFRHDLPPETFLSLM